MIIVGIVLSVFGIGFFCWLLFTLAVYALPFFAGTMSGLASFHSGSGVVGALIVAILAGGATLSIGQIVFATARRPLIRAVIGLLYAAPASIAGYHATLGLSHTGVPSGGWREAFAVVGAILIGGTAWARMSLFVPPYVERRVAGGPASFPLAEATREACACASLPIGWISARSPLVRATGERRAPSQRLDMSAPSPSGG